MASFGIRHQIISLSGYRGKPQNLTSEPQNPQNLRTPEPQNLLRSQPFEHLEPGVHPVFLALTGAEVAVDAAERTQPSTIRPAKRLHGQGQIDLLPDHIAKIDRVIGVERHADVVIVDFALDLLALRRVRLWQE